MPANNFFPAMDIQAPNVAGNFLAGIGQAQQHQQMQMQNQLMQANAQRDEQFRNLLAQSVGPLAASAAQPPGAMPADGYEGGGAANYLMQGTQNPFGPPLPMNQLMQLDPERAMQMQSGFAQQRQQQEAQLRESAGKTVRAAQFVLKSKDPHLTFKIGFPDMVEAFRSQGVNVEDLDDDAVRFLAQRAIEQFGPMAGVGPEVDEEKFGAPQDMVLNGKPAMAQVGSRGTLRPIEGAAPYSKPSSGISFTSPDGTTVQIGGDGVPDYGGVRLTNPTRTKLEDAFVNAQGNSYALREQLSKYRDEFSTLGGRMQAGIANAKEMVGMQNAPQQRQFLSDFTSWKSDTNRLLSSYLNQLSGAAISPAEEERLKGGFPNADDGPTTYKSKAQATMRTFALVQARAAYLLSNPAQSLDSVSIEGMGSIISGEANRLAKSLEKNGTDAEQARAQAIADTRARFGMSDAQ